MNATGADPTVTPGPEGEVKVLPSAGWSLGGVSLRETASATLVLLAVGCGFVLLYLLSGVLFDLFVALVLATAVAPWVDWLTRRGLGRPVAAVLVYGALLAVGLAALVFFVPALLEQASEVSQKLPEHLGKLRERMLASSSSTLQQLGRDLPTRLAADGPPARQLSANDAVAYAGLVGKGAITVLGVLLLGFYWLVDGEVLTRTLLLCFGPERREGLRVFIEESESKVGGYVRGQLIVCALSATMAVGAYLWIGVPNALALGVFFGSLAFLPVLGAPLGALPALLLTASSKPALVPWVIGAAAVVHVIQDYVIAPRVVGKKVGVEPFTVFLALIGFGALLGIPGAMLSIPMAAIIQLLFDRFVFEPLEHPEPPAARGHLSVVRLKAKELAVDVRKQSRGEGEQADETFDKVGDLVESIANDVDRLLGELAAPPGGTAS